MSRPPFTVACSQQQCPFARFRSFYKAIRLFPASGYTRAPGCSGKRHRVSPLQGTHLCFVGPNKGQKDGKIRMNEIPWLCAITDANPWVWFWNFALVPNQVSGFHGHDVIQRYSHRAIMCCMFYIFVSKKQWNDDVLIIYSTNSSWAAIRVVNLCRSMELCLDY